MNASHAELGGQRHPLNQHQEYQLFGRLLYLFVRDYARSKRSRFITLLQAATKSFTNVSFESSHA